MPKITRSPLLLLVSVFLLIITIAVLCDIRCSVNEIIKQTKLLQALHIQWVENNKLIASSANVEQKVASLTAQLKEQASPETTDVLLGLIPIAKVSGVNLQLIKPGIVNKRKNNTDEFLEVGAEANFTQFVALLQSLLQYHFPLQLTHFTLAHHVDNTNRITAKFLLVRDIPRSADKSIDEQAINLPQQLLTLFPLSQIHFVGLIQQGGQRWALVKLPSGRTLPVQIGSIIGAEHATVSAIHRHEISVIQK